MFENLPPQAWETVKEQMRVVQEVDPVDFLTKVYCPVLAIFGEADTSIPVGKSVSRYKQYLREAGNEDITIRLFPKASHTIKVEDDFAPGYFDTINNWLRMRTGK
jgi:alpha-beta hydrolase superfamily lysophospholipase